MLAFALPGRWMWGDRGESATEKALLLLAICCLSDYILGEVHPLPLEFCLIVGMVFENLF